MEKKRILHKIAAIAGAAVLGVALSVTAVALPATAVQAATQPTAESLQMDAKGSITVYFRDSSTKKAVPGGEVTLYKVATVQRDNANLSYVYVNGFENCGISLGNLTDSTLPGKLQSKIQSTASKTTASIDSNGRASFGNLSLGLYLLVQNKTADKYSPVKTFLVSVPMAKDGSWNYNIDATPKMSTSTYNKPPETPPTPSTPTTPTTPTTPNTPTTPSTSSTPATPTTPTTTPTTDVEGVDKDRLDASRSRDKGKLGAARLPQTGQLDWPVPILCIAGLVLFAIGFVLRKEQRD